VRTVSHFGAGRYNSRTCLSDMTLASDMASHRVNRRFLPSLRTTLGVTVAVCAFFVGYLRTAAERQTLTLHPTRVGVYRDGTYSAWGQSIHGRIFATVVIARGRIASATITTCKMRYPCSMIAALPGQVVERQSAGVDAVTGATQSAEAFAIAIDRALEQAARH
jgi:uncharacterized protein with FMN-binding domain